MTEILPEPEEPIVIDEQLRRVAKEMLEALMAPDED